jgi:hypothetical protein
VRARRGAVHPDRITWVDLDSGDAFQTDADEAVPAPRDASSMLGQVR